MRIISMNGLKSDRLYTLIVLMFFATFCSILLFMWEGHYGLNMNDEAFLWYGAIAVNHGQVPIRDFYAYDPGRYYFTAIVMKVLGNDGIIASRIAQIIVEDVALFITLFLLRNIPNKGRRFNLFYIAFISLILLIWMIPLYKIYDIAASIILIGTLSYVIKKNTLNAFFGMGFIVGIIAMFGRNHGVYGIVASIFTIIYLHRTRHQHSLIKSIKFWLFGVLVGYFPLLLMLIMIPGFRSAFITGIYLPFNNHATNLYIPVPWPWQATNLEVFSTGVLFVIVALYVIYGLASVFLAIIKNKVLNPVQIACAFLALPYAHYAFSRADSIHLALGIFPFLIGFFVILFAEQKRSNIFIVGYLVLLLTFSCIVALPLHARVQAYYERNWQSIKVTDSSLKVPVYVKNDIELFEGLIAQYARNNETFLVTPFNLGMYAIFNRKSPIWDLYPLFTRSNEEQTADIARIKKVNPAFVVIYDMPLDGNHQRQFHYTHPIIFKYIKDNFELIDKISGIGDIYLFKQKI